MFSEYQIYIQYFSAFAYMCLSGYLAFIFPKINWLSAAAALFLFVCRGGVISSVMMKSAYLFGLPLQLVFPLFIYLLAFCTSFIKYGKLTANLTGWQSRSARMLLVVLSAAYLFMAFEGFCLYFAAAGLVFGLLCSFISVKLYDGSKTFAAVWAIITLAFLGLNTEWGFYAGAALFVLSVLILLEHITKSLPVMDFKLKAAIKEGDTDFFKDRSTWPNTLSIAFNKNYRKYLKMIFAAKDYSMLSAVYIAGDAWSLDYALEKDDPRAVDIMADICHKKFITGYLGYFVTTAAIKGKMNIVKLLLANAEQQYKDAAFLALCSPLSSNTDTELLKCVFSYGAEVNAADAETGDTALMLLVRRPYGESETLIKFLLDNGADTSLSNKAGKTALDIAGECNNTQAAALLKTYKGKESKKCTQDSGSGLPLL